jgi:hypothetical protein
MNKKACQFYSLFRGFRIVIIYSKRQILRQLRSSKNWLKPKIEPPLVDLTCPNP